MLDLVAMAIDGLLFSELVHHHFGDGISRFAPNVHHLVVALTSGHQTRDILLLDLFDLFLRIRNQAVLFLRHQHVIDTDRNTGTSRQSETVLKQTVRKHHGLFETAFAERRVDESRNFFLLQGLVQIAKRQALGQDLRQKGTANRRLHHRCVGREFTTLFVFGPLGQTHIDLGGQLHDIGVQRTLDFGHVRKDHAFPTCVDALACRVVQTEHHVL